MADVAVRKQPPMAPTGWLRPLPPACRLVFQVGEAARAIVASSFGVGLSTEACRAEVLGSRATLWQGPEEYLLLDTAPEADAARLQDSIAAALGATPASLVDVSHRQVALELSGPHAAQILSCQCPLDLDEAVFPVGYCTRTLFAKADIVLWRTGTEIFRVEAWRSFSEYLVALLTEVARDIAT